MVLNKDYILEVLKQENINFETEGVKILGIFGSYARGNATENSDIDVLIETSEKFLKNHVGFRAYSRLDELKTILSDKFEKKIDFADKSSLGKLGKKHILENYIYV